MSCRCGVGTNHSVASGDKCCVLQRAQLPCADSRCRRAAWPALAGAACVHCAHLDLRGVVPPTHATRCHVHPLLTQWPATATCFCRRELLSQRGRVTKITPNWSTPPSWPAGCLPASVTRTPTSREHHMLHWRVARATAVQNTMCKPVRQVHGGLQCGGPRHPRLKHAVVTALGRSGVAGRQAMSISTPALRPHLMQPYYGAMQTAPPSPALGLPPCMLLMSRPTVAACWLQGEVLVQRTWVAKVTLRLVGIQMSAGNPAGKGVLKLACDGGSHSIACLPS